MKYSKLLQPKHNPFALYIYSIDDQSIIYKALSPEKLSLSKLNDYKGEGTYCNSYNNLFISEANNFWVINHSSFQIRYKKMPIAKNNHSIIYVPSANPNTEEGKIFVVGGNDKKSIYYDLKKNYFLKWAPTNAVHTKPALIKITDYLYLFDSIQQKDFCFERTNLLNKEQKWEKITPKIEPNIMKNFPSQFFGVSLDDNKNVVFLGGDNIDIDNNKTYIYDIKYNKIFLSDKGTNDSMNFTDKTFYEINNKYNVALPSDFEELKEVAYIDKNEQSLIRKNVEDKNSCQESQKELEINKNINYQINLDKKIKINEPIEFGYYISSYSSEESKIRAKKDNIKIIEKHEQKCYTIRNINIKDSQLKKEEKNK